MSRNRSKWRNGSVVTLYAPDAWEAINAEAKRLNCTPSEIVRKAWTIARDRFAKAQDPADVVTRAQENLAAARKSGTPLLQKC